MARDTDDAVKDLLIDRELFPKKREEDSIIFWIEYLRLFSGD